MFLEDSVLLGQSGSMNFPKIVLRIGKMLPEPLLETRNLVLCFVESRNPPALSIEDTSELRPRLFPQSLYSESLVSPCFRNKNLLPQEFVSGKRQSFLLGLSKRGH